MNRYNCNRYDEREAKSARDAQEKSRAALQRYLFYCNRYLNHMQSLKFEHKVIILLLYVLVFYGSNYASFSVLNKLLLLNSLSEAAFLSILFIKPLDMCI